MHEILSLSKLSKWYVAALTPVPSIESGVQKRLVYIPLPLEAPILLQQNFQKKYQIIGAPSPNEDEAPDHCLLLDLDDGGMLTMCTEGKPYGTIAEGLAGPLLPCGVPLWGGKVVAITIYSGCAPTTN